MLTDGPELHEIADSPGWDTKQHCTCGFESVSKCEQWKHASDELRAQVETAERQRDELAAENEQLWRSNEAHKVWHAAAQETLRQRGERIEILEQAVAALDTPPAKEA